MEKIFMETTVQADKFLGQKKIKDQIRQICKSKKLISSTYVLGEFKATFLKDAVSLYNLVNDSNTIGEALKRLENIYSKRISNRMCKLLGSIIEDCGPDNKEEILDRLEIYIEDLLVKRFKDNIDKILIDNTKCIRSFSKPFKQDGVWRINVNCAKNPRPKCAIKEFLDNNVKNLEKMKGLPVHLKKVEDLILDVINNNECPYGNNCRTLGDTIIALECPEDAALFTRNKKDFEPICRKLNKVIV